jgi:hypothetical protein
VCTARVNCRCTIILNVDVTFISSDTVAHLELSIGGLYGYVAAKEFTVTDSHAQLNFAGLVDAIRKVHEHCTSQAGKAVNVSLTLRNWVIGYYILEYEQRGADRAFYGERMLENLSDRLQLLGMS